MSFSPEDYSKKKSELEEQKKLAEATFDAEGVGEAEKALADLEAKKQQFEAMNETAGDATESQVKQVENLGGSKEILNEKVAEGTKEEVKEVESVREKISEKEHQSVQYEKGKIYKAKLSDGLIIEVQGLSNSVQKTNEVKPREYVRVRATQGNLETDLEVNSLMERVEQKDYSTLSFKEQTELNHSLGQMSREDLLKVIEKYPYSYRSENRGLLARIIEQGKALTAEDLLKIEDSVTSGGKNGEDLILGAIIKTEKLSPEKVKEILARGGGGAYIHQAEQFIKESSKYKSIL